ncbi:MAG: class I SAM-dependent methyltransferase [Bacteroidota bacterium]|jgi:hypothetical protein
MFNKILRLLKRKNQLNNDDFIKRIRTLLIGEGMLHDGNIPLIETAIKNMPNNGNVIEIGSYGGLSTNLIIYLMQKHKRNNTMLNCDAWIYEGFNDQIKNNILHIDGRVDVLREDYSNYMKKAFINATKFISIKNLPHSFHMKSDLFFSKWNKQETETDLFGREVKLGGEISFAYIDGGHSYEVVLNDFENVANHLVIDGFMLIDDSAPHLNFGSAKIIGKNQKG